MVASPHTDDLDCICSPEGRSLVAVAAGPIQLRLHARVNVLNVFEINLRYGETLVSQPRAKRHQVNSVP